MFQAVYWALEYADQEERFPASWELTGIESDNKQLVRLNRRTAG